MRRGSNIRRGGGREKCGGRKEIVGERMSHERMRTRIIGLLVRDLI